MSLKNNRLLAVVTLSLATASAEPSERFYEAIHQVETGGKLGATTGDNGRAFGPLQIHREAFLDSEIKGVYLDCKDLSFSVRVCSAYLKRYAPEAWKNNDVETLARVWNGGPNGAKKPATSRYAKKVLLALEKLSHP